MTEIKVSLFLLLNLFVCLNVSGEVFNGPTDLSWKLYDSLSINGPSKLKKVKANSIEIKGPLQFHSLAVAGKAEVIGDINGDNGKFGQLNVTGSMNVDHVICEELSVKGPVTAVYLDVKNHADIDGELNAHHSKFKSLAVKADKIILDEVILDSLVVRKGQKNQILVLQGPTIVNGDIVFESGDGVVQVGSLEVRIKGTVKGAFIKKG